MTVNLFSIAQNIYSMFPPNMSYFLQQLLLLGLGSEYASILESEEFELVSLLDIVNFLQLNMK